MMRYLLDNVALLVYHKFLPPRVNLLLVDWPFLVYYWRPCWIRHCIGMVRDKPYSLLVAFAMDLAIVPLLLLHFI